MRNQLLKSIFVSLILVMGISNAWAASEGSSWYDWASSENVYFDNTNSSYTDVSMLIGRQWNYGGDGVGSSGVNFTKISNTNNLYHAAATWNHYNTLLFIDAKDWGWEGDKKVTQRYSYASNYTNTNNVNIDGTELFYAASSTKGATLNHQDLNSYTALNYTQTVQQHLSTDGGSNYSASTTALATVKVSSYKLKSKNATESSSGTIASESSSANCSAARTATVTYTVTDVKSGYTFVGWYDGTTKKSTNTTYTYQATEAKIITARFSKEPKHTVTISYKCGTKELGSETKEVGESTAGDVAAKDIEGYGFTNWSAMPAGINLTSGNLTDKSISITATQEATITANYEEDLSSNWHLVGKNSAFPDGWNITEASMMKKLSGRSTEKVVYMTLNVQNLETHEFKVVDDNGSSDDIWYGYSSGDTYQIWDKTATKKVYSGGGNGNNLKFTPTIKGEYEFKVDYSGTYPDVTITYPEIPVVAVKLAGTMTGWETPAAFTINGTTATLTLTLTQGYYQFKMIETTLVDAKEKDNWYGNGGTMTRKNCTNWTFDSDANATIFADADGAYTFEWDITTDKLSVTNMPAFPDLSNQPTTLYFRPSTNWKENNPKYAAYFCYGDKTTEDKWVELTPDNGIYKVDNSDKQYVMVIFVRLKSGGALSWDDKWGQTDNLIIPNTPNNLNTCFAFWKNAWDDVSGLWVAPTPLTDANWSAFITAYKGKTINALVERSFNYNQLHTLCLPFNLPTNWLGDEAKAYQLTGVVSNSATELELKAIETTTIAAGKPYIVRPTKGPEYEYVIVSDVTVADATAGSYTVQGGNYQVTMQAIAATPNPAQQTDGSTEYWIAVEDGCLYKTKTNKLGLRAIIKMTTTTGAPVNVRARVVTDENVETGVEDIITTDTPVKVIENGQLIIIRDGVKYNVQGQKL